jgi:predicted amidohydrolase
LQYRDENLEQISAFADEAAARGSRLVALPEAMNLGGNTADHGLRFPR